MNNRKTAVKASVAAAALASVLLTGCASSEPSATATTAPASASPSPSASATPTFPEEQIPKPGPFDDKLVIDGEQVVVMDSSQEFATIAVNIPAGVPVRVSGGGHEPGSFLKIQGWKDIAPTPDPETGEMVIGEEAPLTEAIDITVDEKGQFDVQLTVPAGTPPQAMKVMLMSPEGVGTSTTANIL